MSATYRGETNPDDSETRVCWTTESLEQAPGVTCVTGFSVWQQLPRQHLAVTQEATQNHAATLQAHAGVLALHRTLVTCSPSRHSQLRM